MQKIIIIGCPGSGKTTFANKLASILEIPVHHLDKIFWKENWTPSHQKEFIEAQNELMKGERWIIDGGFVRSKSLDFRLENADTIIFFDFSLHVIFYREIKRFFQYFNKVRPDMGGNNRHKFPITWKQIKFAWNYPTEELYLKVENYSQKKKVFVFRKSKETDVFLKNISTKT